MKYKVTVGVNWFECPTSLETEGVIKTIYISGNNEKEVEKSVQDIWKGRFSIIKIEEYETLR